MFQRQPVATYMVHHENPKHIFISDNTDKIVFTGLDIPGNGPVGWDWKPSYKKGTQKILTFYKDRSKRWTRHWETTYFCIDICDAVGNTADTIDLIINGPTIKFAGSIVLVQREPNYEILQQYEIFGINVVANPQSPMDGSDVTLSCTISRLPDTVSLRWKPVGSSQQKRRNTDQIWLNNNVYLMLQHVTVEDGKLYQCEVQENGNVVGTMQADFTVRTRHHEDYYTLFRSVMDHSEFHLICYSHAVYSKAVWTWESHFHQSPRKAIATALKSQPVTVSESHFMNRLMFTETPFNGQNFSMKVFPVVFEDAGDYTCTLDGNKFTAIILITVKVTAEPYDTVTEGDTVTLSCSVSNVTASMRLVWINGDGETVGNKTLNGEEKSLSLVIQKAERGSGKWRCLVFDQERLRLSVPYDLEVRVTSLPDSWIITIAGYLFVKLAVGLGLFYSLTRKNRMTPQGCNKRGLDRGRR